MTPEHFQQSIRAARAEGFTHYAQALERLYQRQFPHVHPEACSFKWQTVTGADFGRSIKWARGQGNEMRRKIREGIGA